jgi:nitroreductase
VLRSAAARAVVSEAARRTWQQMAEFYGLEIPSPEAVDAKSRVLRAMWEHTQIGGDAPVCVMFCVRPQAGTGELQQGGSIFPAVQNFLLAARAQGLGAAITLWHDSSEEQLRALVGMPEDWRIAALVTARWPKGGHHEVCRKPVGEVAAVDNWENCWSVTV